ncbi:MAG: B12-binding domain-containing radical SAM protein [bacterium]
MSKHMHRDDTRSPTPVHPAESLNKGLKGGRLRDDRVKIKIEAYLAYDAAVATIEAGLQLASAAYTPLSLDFTCYRTPFSLLTMGEIHMDAQAGRDPFHEYFTGVLCERLATEGINLVGISVAFPGQVQPAYSLAFILRRKLPHVYLTVGGPAITQFLVRLKGERLRSALGPFHSAVLFEGEDALLDLIQGLEKGERPSGVIRGGLVSNLGRLPAPDFDGLPIDQYLAPSLVLPYDPSRGCYWGRCAFCHYGLAESGTVCYRERPVEQVVEHLDRLSKRYNCGVFYFSEDSLAPATALRLARAFRNSGHSWRWSTDMRPEPVITPEYASELAEGGALSIAVGVESASRRILRLINKGISIAESKTAIRNLASADIAVEVMCFTDFPTETAGEAFATLRFLDEYHTRIALFMCGRFHLTHGAPVAMNPRAFGIRDIWEVSGDELGTGIFYEEKSQAKTRMDHQRIGDAIRALSAGWWLHRYPWAGSLSTAHTLLWFDQHGPDVFRRYAGVRSPSGGSGEGRGITKRLFDVRAISEKASEHEARIWHTLVYRRRSVTRRDYEELARTFPPAGRISRGPSGKRGKKRI